MRYTRAKHNECKKYVGSCLLTGCWARGVMHLWRRPSRCRFTPCLPRGVGDGARNNPILETATGATGQATRPRCSPNNSTWRGISDGLYCILVSLTLLSHCSRQQAPPTPVASWAYVWVARLAPGLQSFCVGLGVHHSCARPCLSSIRQQNGSMHYTSTSCLPQVVHACAPCGAACAWQVAHKAYNRSVAMRSAMWEWYMT